MDLNDYLRSVFALLFVLGLIGLLYLLARRYASRRLGLAARGVPGGRLGVVEMRPLDGRRRLVLVRRDDVEHLLLLGPERDLLLETGIPARPAPAAAAPARPPAGRSGFEASLARAEDREPRL